MDPAFLEKFLELLEVIVDADGTWQEKKALLVAECNEADQANIEEFVSWFTPDEASAA